jgi:predicted aldo/keto reductase-like oxidoreductase
MDQTLFLDPEQNSYRDLENQLDDLGNMSEGSLTEDELQLVETVTQLTLEKLKVEVEVAAGIERIWETKYLGVEKV